MHPEVKALIEHYRLQPLPVEGTLFASTYRSPQEYENGGDPLRLILLYPDGSSRDVIMGNDPLKGQLVQFVIPAGVWQAGHMVEDGRYSLFGCTVAPGFTDDIFEGGTREGLLSLYPDRADDINKLSVNGETNMPEGFAT
jgi:predicted cupin superfamily sugar epimerase